MAVNNKIEQIPMKAISELQGYTFIIPFLQRGYKWTSDNVKDLLLDLWNFMHSRKKIYCLQPLAIVKDDENGNIYRVLDGQQRLTTLFILWKFLCGENPYTFRFERDEKSDIGNLGKRMNFLNELTKQNDSAAINDSIDCFFIHNAYRTIVECFEDEAFSFFSNFDEEENAKKKGLTLSEYIKEKFKKLLKATAGKKDSQTIQVIWYEVDKAKEHEVFRSLNSGKIALNNSELIKALFLNRVSGLGENNISEAASQLELMERIVQNDHFWYMLSPKDVRNGQSRMDLIYNLVAGISHDAYERDSRSSFRWFAKDVSNKVISEKWKDVRYTFQRLYDMYSDIYIYHYVGFLTYVGGNENSLKSLLELYESCCKSDFVSKLRNRVKKTLWSNSLEEYSYGSTPTGKLRQLFVLHNIETILQRYEYLHKNDTLRLQHEYEWFPFELLHKQRWDIEHIASLTDSNLDKKQDKDDWIKSNKDFLSEKGKELLDKYRNAEPKEANKYFNMLFNGEDSNEIIKEEDKDKLGNLVLLDSHTNRSYHNSLFPRKRRFVLIADGMRADLTDGNKDGNNIQPLYIPICTRQCFTKAYNKDSDVKFNIWTQKDAEYYLNDIKKKLKYYLQNTSI